MAPTPVGSFWEDAPPGVGGGATLIRKTADETVNNSNVLQDDDGLVLSVGVNEVWALFMLLRITTTGVADFKWAFTIPAGATMRNSGTMQALGGVTGSFDSTAAQTQVSIGDVVDAWVLIKAIYVGGGNAGNVQLQWAQNVAEATDTKVLANSFIRAHQLA